MGLNGNGTDQVGNNYGWGKLRLSLQRGTLVLGTSLTVDDALSQHPEYNDRISRALALHEARKIDGKPPKEGTYHIEGLYVTISTE